jgi:hypothetical protein
MALWLLLQFLSSTASLSGPFEVFVSLTGDDAANGTRDAPLQHLLAARDRVRQLRQGSAPYTGQIVPARIWLMSGTFTLDVTLNLTAADSNVSWHGLSDTKSPVISGGKTLEWAVEAAANRHGCRMLRARGVVPNIGRASVGMIYPQLYIHGKRAQISRQPAKGLTDPQAYFEWRPTTPSTASAFRFNSTAVSPDEWAENGTLSDITALLFTAPWTGEPHRIKSVDKGSETIQLLAPAASLEGRSKIQGVKRWIGLNTPGPLEPGSYSYSSATQELAYSDCSNATQLPSATVSVSGMTTLVRLTEHAVGVSFVGVSFAHTSTGALPSNFSYGAAESGAVEVGPMAADIRFEAVSFAATGNNALQVFPGVRGVTVEGCTFVDVGGRGFSTTLEHTSAKQDAEDLLVTDSVRNK